MQDIPPVGCVLEVPLAFTAKRLLRTPAAFFGFPAAGGSNSAAAAAAVGTLAVLEAAASGDIESVSARQLVIRPLLLQVITRLHRLAASPDLTLRVQPTRVCLFDLSPASLNLEDHHVVCLVTERL